MTNLIKTPFNWLQAWEGTRQSAKDSIKREPTDYKQGYLDAVTGMLAGVEEYHPESPNADKDILGLLADKLNKDMALEWFVCNDDREGWFVVSEDYEVEHVWGTWINKELSTNEKYSLEQLKEIAEIHSEYVLSLIHI